MRLVSAVLVLTTTLLPLVSTGIADAPAPPPRPAVVRAAAPSPPAPRPVVRRAARALDDHDLALGVLLLLATHGRRATVAP